MKLPAFLQLKPKPKGKKLEASARRASQADDYAEEPHMRLSSAFVVVLLLHVVAIGGIYAFSAVKERRAPAPEKSASAPVKQAVGAPASSPAAAMGASAASYVAGTTKPARATGSPVKTSAPAASSGTTYTVAKGDNPVSIAKKLHVGYEDLIKLNKIEDPRKLQIGQKLHVPAAKNVN